MKRIQTQNLRIDPELCQRMDRAIYSTRATPPPLVLERAKVYRDELLAVISEYSPRAAEIEKDACLYRLCLVAERLANDWARHDSERGHANMQTAHNQLKNWR